MCGRYALTATAEDVLEFFSVAMVEDFRKLRQFVVVRGGLEGRRRRRFGLDGLDRPGRPNGDGLQDNQEHDRDNEDALHGFIYNAESPVLSS